MIPTDTNITISPRWILRNDLNYNNQHCLYNIDNENLTYINEGLYQIIRCFYYNSLSYKALKTELAKHGIVLPFANPSDLEGEFGLEKLFIESSIPLHSPSDIQQIGDVYTVPVCSTPMNIELHLTHNCNLKCLHCFQSSTSHSNHGTLLSPDTWDNIFSQMEDAKVLSVVISGGEPFMYPDADNLLRKLARKRISIAILTNGLRINENNIDIFKNKNVSATISLDGHTAETHELLRGKNTFIPTIRTIRLLKQNNAKFAIAHTLHSRNYLHFKEFVKFMISEGVTAMSVSFVEPEGRAAINKPLILNKSIEHNMRKILRQIADEYSTSIKIDFPDLSAKQELSGFSNEEKVFCAAGTKRMAISSNGKTYPCLYAFGIPELETGDLTTDSLIDIWQSSHSSWNSVRGNTNLHDIETCGTCKLNTSCALRNCRIKYYHKNGNMLSKPDNCMIDNEPISI